MSLQSLKLPVTPFDIPEEGPLPCDIYTADDVLLCKKGEVELLDYQKRILRSQGFKISNSTKPIPSPSYSLPSLEVTMPIRQLLPLEDADVLIADDMPLMRSLLIQMLRKNGIKKLTTVDDGKKAIIHFFYYQPHIVFLDIDMPELNGIIVLKQIKNWSPNTFVCMITGNSTLINVQQTKAIGVDAFLVKPVSPLNMERVLALYRSKLII